MSRALSRPALARPAALALLLGALAAGAARAQEAGPPPGQFTPRITVSGRGVVEAAPANAVVQVAVVTRAATAGAALELNSTAAAGVLTLARAAGVEARNVVTAGVTLAPRTKQVTDGRGNTQTVPDGYEARNAVNVRVSVAGGDTARLGRFLRAAADEGATAIAGLRFEPENPERALEDAGAAAVEDALRRATRMAAAAGARLGPVERIAAGRRFERADVPMMAQARESAPVPVAAGALSISADADVTWALLPATQ